MVGVYDWPCLAVSLDPIADRLKKAVEMDGQAAPEAADVLRFAKALHAMDQAGELDLFEFIQKAQRTQCAQDSVVKLRQDFLVIRRTV